jgi:hypothetical protein
MGRMVVNAWRRTSVKAIMIPSASRVSSVLM